MSKSSVKQLAASARLLCLIALRLAGWGNMRESGVDVIISAPQKVGLRHPPQGSNAVRTGHGTDAGYAINSFAIDVKMVFDHAGYENDGHAYHAAMPAMRCAFAIRC